LCGVMMTDFGVDPSGTALWSMPATRRDLNLSLFTMATMSDIFTVTSLPKCKNTVLLPLGQFIALNVSGTTDGLKNSGFGKVAPQTVQSLANKLFG